MKIVRVDTFHCHSHKDYQNLVRADMIQILKSMHKFDLRNGTISKLAPEQLHSHLVLKCSSTISTSIVLMQRNYID